MSRLEVPMEEGNYTLDLRKRYLIVAGDANQLSRERSSAIAERAVKYLQEQNLAVQTPPNLRQVGVPRTGLQAGESGPMYNHPMSTTQLALDARSIAAIAFCAGGALNPETASYEGMAGTGVTLSLRAIQNELMMGLKGSVGMGFELTQALSSPFTTVADAANGWFISDRFSVRIYQLSFGSLEWVARTQVEQSYLGLNVIGWVGIGFRTK